MEFKKITNLHKLQNKCKYGLIIISNPHKRRLTSIKKYMQENFNKVDALTYDNIIKYNELHILKMYAFHQVDYVEIIDYDIESLVEKGYNYIIRRN